MHRNCHFSSFVILSSVPILTEVSEDVILALLLHPCLSLIAKCESLVLAFTLAMSLLTSLVVRFFLGTHLLYTLLSLGYDMPVQQIVKFEQLHIHSIRQFLLPSHVP